MHRLIIALALLSSPAALATGEKIVLVPATNNQLHETLCLSMECVGKGAITVATRVVKGGVEVTVTAEGQLKLVQQSPADADGQLSSTDLVRLTSAVLKAIEAPALAHAAPPKAPTKPLGKLLRSHLKLVARR
jgi:hypothetical protein